MSTTKATKAKNSARIATRTDIRYFHDGMSLSESHKHKLSTLAYFYSKGLTSADSTRCSTHEFVNALNKAGVADPTQPGWMVKLPNGITVECRLEHESSKFTGTKPTPAKATKPVAKKTPGQKARESAAAKKPAPKAAAKRNGSTKVTPLPKKSTAKRSTRKSA